MIKEHALNQYRWVEIVNPQEAELTQVISKYQFPEKFKDYMMDRHEQPRATFDALSNAGVLVVRALATDLDTAATTVPVFLGFNDDVLITACHGQTLSKLINQQASVTYSTLSDHIFAILRAILRPYFDTLNVISQQAEQFAGHSRMNHISNRRLAVITVLKTKLVYLRSAAAGNLVALQELQDVLKQKLTMTADLSRQVSQQIADLVIEYRQCQSMFDVQAGVVSETEAAYGNILNNRLNQTMKFLTVWSLVLAVPPIVSGFYGMNVKLPLADHSEAWLDTLVITLGLVLGMVILYLWQNKKQ